MTIHLYINLVSILKQMNEIALQAQPVSKNTPCTNASTITTTSSQDATNESYDQHMHSLINLVKQLHRILSTHSDIVIIRYISVIAMKKRMQFKKHDAFIVDYDIKAGDFQDLPSLLVQLLHMGTQLWFQSLTRYSDQDPIHTTARNIKETGKVVDDEDDVYYYCTLTDYYIKNNSRLANTLESKLLSFILQLHYDITKMDCVLGEEIARTGSHSILSQIIQYDITHMVTSVFFQFTEVDLDFIYEIQDYACSIGKLPIHQHPLIFPIKATPYSNEELMCRLPIPFSLQLSSSSSPLTCLYYSHNDHDPCNIDLQAFTLLLSSKSVLWIQHITERQSEQFDVGYVTWPSSIALSQWLIDHCHEVINQKTILELGAGTGLVGMVVAKLIAHHTEIHKDTYHLQGGRVILSDYNPLVLDNIQRSIQLNNLQDYAEISCLDFYHQNGRNHTGGWLESLPTLSRGHDETSAIPHLRPREAVDIILAADVICQPSDSISLSKTIYDALRPGGKAFVTSAASAHRFGVDYFPSECFKRGLIVTESTLIPHKNMNGIYLSTTSGFVEGMEMKLYEIVKH